MFKKDRRKRSDAIGRDASSGWSRGTFWGLFKVGANFASFYGLRRSVVITHTARMFFLWAEQQLAEFLHLKKEKEMLSLQMTTCTNMHSHLTVKNGLCVILTSHGASLTLLASLSLTFDSHSLPYHMWTFTSPWVRERRLNLEQTWAHCHFLSAPDAPWLTSCVCHRALQSL